MFNVNERTTGDIFLKELLKVVLHRFVVTGKNYVPLSQLRNEFDITRANLYWHLKKLEGNQFGLYVDFLPNNEKNKGVYVSLDWLVNNISNEVNSHEIN